MSAERSGSTTITQTPEGPGRAMAAQTLPPVLPVVTVATAMSPESLALQQAQALVKEQQQQMRRQAEHVARDQAELKAAVGEKDKELEKARKLVAGAERNSQGTRLGREDNRSGQTGHAGGERKGVASDGPSRGADETTCPGRSCGNGIGIEEIGGAGEIEMEIVKWNGWK